MTAGAAWKFLLRSTPKTAAAAAAGAACGITALNMDGVAQRFSPPTTACEAKAKVQRKVSYRRIRTRMSRPQTIIVMGAFFLCFPPR